MKYFRTIVVGAGPCGLAAAIELEKNDMDYLVLEEGNVVHTIFIENGRFHGKKIIQDIKDKNSDV